MTAAAVRCGIGVATSTNEAFFEVTAGRLQAGGGKTRLPSKSGSERSVGSIPTTRTTFNLKVNRRPKSSNLTRLAGVGENANFDLPIPLNHIQRPAVKMRKRDRLRAERIVAAGGPMPNLRERAVMLAEKLGEVRTRDLTEVGIPRCYLTRMCEEGLLIKVGYGRYRAVPRRAA